MFLRTITSLARGNRLLRHTRLLCSTAEGKVEDFTKNVPNQALVDQTEQRHDENLLLVKWKDRTVSRFPYVYLRDLCTCSRCLNRNSLERLSDTTTQVSLDIKASNVTVSSNGDTVVIHWPDHHITEFQSAWLHSKKLAENDERKELISSANITRKGVRIWDRNDMQDNIPRFNYNTVLEEDQSLFEWLSSLHSVGIALLESCPTYTDPTACEVLSKRVGYVKSTHYGYLFDIFVKFDANNLAYTTATLPLHCDLPYIEYYPGVQLLQCLQQAPTQGGGNMFVDGFQIAQDFKTSEPDLFDLLSVTAIPYFDVGKSEFGNFHFQHARPVFELDYNGKITRFTYSNIVRNYFLKGDPEKVKQIYNGYMKMGMMMRDPKNRIDHKLKPGEMMTLNNSRVLHGRTAYTVTKTGNRHMQGNYLDWDLIYARLRSLGKSLGQPFQE